MGTYGVKPTIFRGESLMEKIIKKLEFEVWSWYQNSPIPCIEGIEEPNPVIVEYEITYHVTNYNAHARLLNWLYREYDIDKRPVPEVPHWYRKAHEYR